MANNFLDNVDQDQLLFGAEGDWAGDTGEGLVYHSDLATVPGLTNAFFHMPDFHDDPSSTPGVIVQPDSSHVQFAAHDVATFPSNEGVSSAWENMDFISSHGSYSNDPFHQGALGMQPSMDFAQPWDVPFIQNLSFDQAGSFGSHHASDPYASPGPYGSSIPYGSLDSHLSRFHDQRLDVPLAVDVFNVAASPDQFSSGLLHPNSFSPTSLNSPNFIPPSMARTNSTTSFMTAVEEQYVPEIDMDESLGNINNQYIEPLPSPTENIVAPAPYALSMASPSPAATNSPVQTIPRPDIFIEHTLATKAIAIPSKKGRRGPLKQKTKEDAAKMRRIKACSNCKLRKTKVRIFS
jgi:hypothetical protein